MAQIILQGTKFSFSILPNKKEYWTNIEICIENEYIRYKNATHAVTRDELESLVFSMHRLLAGAYAKEYSLSFEKAGIAVDLYTTFKEGKTLTREERRKEDCTAVFRILLKDASTQAFLGGVYSFILHKKELMAFANSLIEEFQSVYGDAKKEDGEYLFVGVSPKGFVGCNYWYLDATNSTKAGDYVWVRMGRHNTEQVVYVDSTRYFTKENAPFPIERVKQVLKKATEEEIENAKKEWSQEK